MNEGNIVKLSSNIFFNESMTKTLSVNDTVKILRAVQVF
jgi:hypothetical protein